MVALSWIIRLLRVGLTFVVGKALMVGSLIMDTMHRLMVIFTRSKRVREAG